MHTRKCVGGVVTSDKCSYTVEFAWWYCVTEKILYSFTEMVQYLMLFGCSECLIHHLFAQKKNALAELWPFHPSPDLTILPTLAWNKSLAAFQPGLLVCIKNKGLCTLGPFLWTFCLSLIHTKTHRLQYRTYTHVLGNMALGQREGN